MSGASRPSIRFHTPAGRPGWTVLAAVVCALALVLPGVARAQEIPRLQGQVTDLSSGQVLSGGRAQIDAALAELLQSQNVQLFVLFVESTGGRTVTAFADEVARQNSLGGNDALLVVAVSDRTDALWRGSASLSRLTDRELEDVLSRRVEPLLARGDFAGAVVAGANGVAEVAGEGSTGADQPGGGGSTVPRVLLLAALGGGGLLAWRAVSGRRRRRAEAQYAQETERLSHEANALLITADEALRDAREEIGFAEAQFSEADVAAYREAVARASDELMAAFTLRQQLDDAVPEDAETRRRIVEDVTARARSVQALLDEQAQRIKQLRDLERTAPEVLGALPAQLDALEARLPAAERTRTSLERYAERSWASVKGNIVAARDVIAQARAAVADGQRALGTDDRAAAGRGVRTAQQSAAEGARLLDAVEHLATSLRQAEETAASQMVAVAADVRAARAALAGGTRADLAQRLVEAERALQQAEGEMAAERPDFLAAMRLIAQADTIADAALVELRQEAERRERERRMLAAQLQAAETDYDRAADFIASRRRLIGGAARTRLAEAERHLASARALAGDDPSAALAEARRAEELADDAYRRARDDFEDSEPYGGGWGGPRRGGVILPIPIPFPSGGGWGGRSMGGGGIRIGGGGGSGGGSGGGRSVGGRW